MNINDTVVKKEGLNECVRQFNDLFNTDNEIVDLILRIRWPNGFQCSRCSHTDAYQINSRNHTLFECHKCNFQTSITSGTIMHKSRTSPRKWLITMYILATHQHSLTATSLSNLISVTYKTAWAMLNKIRRVISGTDRQTLLLGHVEAKLSLYREQFLPSTQKELQLESPAIIANGTTPHNTSYYKIKMINRTELARKNLNADEFNLFSNTHISSEAITTVVHKRHFSPYKYPNKLQKVAQQAFKWISKTFNGLNKKNIQPYLDEYCFRLNYPSHNTTICPFTHLLQLGINKCNTIL